MVQELGRWQPVVHSTTLLNNGLKLAGCALLFWAQAVLYAVVKACVYCFNAEQLPESLQLVALTSLTPVVVLQQDRAWSVGVGRPLTVDSVWQVGFGPLHVLFAEQMAAGANLGIANNMQHVWCTCCSSVHICLITQGKVALMSKTQGGVRTISWDPLKVTFQAAHVCHATAAIFGAVVV